MAPLPAAMPHDLNAEQSVLGSILLDNDVLPDVCDELRVDDFYNPLCQKVFAAIVELYRESSPVDLVTLSDKMGSMGVPENVRSPEELGHIIVTVPTSTNVAKYVQIVKDKSYTRKLIRMTKDILERGYKNEEPSSQLIQSAESEIFRLSESLSSAESGDMSMFDIVMETLESINEAAANGGMVTGISTGFKYLDSQTAGLQPSDLILIAARPSMGKTAFALNIAENTALKQGIPTAIFSLEMSAVQLTKRFLSMHSGVNAQNIRTGQLSFDEWRQVTESANEYAAAKIFIDDTPGITLTQLRTKCRRLKAQQGLGIVFIDYLQLMEDDGRSNSIQEKTSKISRGLKAIAREIKCPIVALSQLSRSLESRTDKRPILSDLRDSGAIEQDADVVMFLHRDSYHDHDAEDQDVTEVIIGKQRNGPIGTIKLKWIAEQTKFANLEYKKRDE